MTGIVTWEGHPMTQVDLRQNIATGDSYLRVGSGRTCEEYLAVGNRTFLRAGRSLYARSSNPPLPARILDQVDNVWVDTTPAQLPLTYAKVLSDVDLSELLDKHSTAAPSATVSSDHVGQTRAWRLRIPQRSVDAWISMDGSFDLLRIRQTKISGGPADVDLAFGDHHSHPTFTPPPSTKTLDEIANGR